MLSIFLPVTLSSAVSLQAFLLSLVRSARPSLELLFARADSNGATIRPPFSLVLAFRLTLYQPPVAAGAIDWFYKPLHRLFQLLDLFSSLYAGKEIVGVSTTATDAAGVATPAAI